MNKKELFKEPIVKECFRRWVKEDWRTPEEIKIGIERVEEELGIIIQFKKFKQLFEEWRKENKHIQTKSKLILKNPYHECKKCGFVKKVDVSRIKSQEPTIICFKCGHASKLNKTSRTNQGEK